MVDPQAPGAMHDLMDADALHKTLAKAFCQPDVPSEVSGRQLAGARLLFQVEEHRTGRGRVDASSAVIWTRSKSPPQWDQLTVSPQFLLAKPLVWQRALKFKEGDALDYRIILSAASGHRHLPIENSQCAQERWRCLLRDSGAQGLRFLCLKHHWYSGKLQMRGEKHTAWWIEGRLTVIDPNAFAERYAEGFGRNRAHGFGMIRVFP